MNVDDLTLGQIKQLKQMFGNCKTEDSFIHPDIGRKVIVRTYSAGVHYGTLEYKRGNEVRLKNSIRIWYWDGACSLSQLAVDGTKKPNNCKFAVPVEAITIEMVEIIPCSEVAIRSIEGVAPWKE